VSKKVRTAGILSPGDMGHTVGQVLRGRGLRVITCLSGRSARTRALARKAQIVEVDSITALVQQADVVLSIVAPDQAVRVARAVAEALFETTEDLLFVDCNAIAPVTVKQIGSLITAAGGRFVDASIIGPPPRQPGATRFYASGPHAAEFARLSEFGLDVRVLSRTVGDASAIKMCYAALTKGLTALATELLTAGQALGVGEALGQELQLSQPALYDLMQRQVPGMPTKARRWVGEMEEIAHTFGGVGLTPRLMDGVADMYRFVASTPLANRTPEDTSPPPSLDQVIGELVQHLTGSE
jgi:3-hydroxyisobutyrate dehydrogenase-like beta-hydroxyacid dehydrogenase